MFLQRLFLSCTLLSVGLAWPTVSHSELLSQTPTEVLDEAPSTPNSISEGEVSAAPFRLQIEDRFEAIEDGAPLSYRFSGRENEIVVVYAQTNSDFGWPEVLLRLDRNESIPVERIYYPSDIDFAEYSGRHTAFNLPETGVYYLSVESELADVSGASLSVRSASYYERLMIAVEEKMDAEQYDDAAVLAGLAIAQRPELPMPHVSRVFAYAAKIYESPALLEELESLEAPNDILEAMRNAFSRLDASEQANAISDLRQVVSTYESAVESGVADADVVDSVDTDFLAGFSHVADFLETGEVTEAMMMIFFGVDR
ncbi:MAG: hypothetical protein ACFB0D_05745 [Phormidesmis sp.]